MPRAGEFVWGELKFADGTSSTVRVDALADGGVRTSVFPGAPDAVASIRPRSSSAAWYAAESDAQEADASDMAALGASPSAAAPDAETTATASGSSECRDSYYRHYGWKMPDHRWRFQASSTPRYLSSRSNGVATVVAVLRRANANIVNARNACGRGDAIGARFEYLGTTSRGANISSDASCSGRDGYSVVSFGSLPSNVIAMACVRGLSSGIAKEGDIRINTRVRWETSPRLCSGETLLAPAMTHEFGHIYGLAHAYNRPLTMNPYIANCRSNAETLGLGDMIGLERKY